MREIIFRGKRIDNGKWIEGYYTKQSNHACFTNELKYQHFIFKDVFLDFNLGGFQEFEIEPETVGQYTGLTDKNGTKIFEGDIIRVGWFLFGLEILPAVAFKDGAFGLEWNGDKEFRAFTSMSNIEYEVVGNIFDNPNCGAIMDGDAK